MTISRAFIVFSFLVCIGVLFLAAVSHRPMALDGAAWYFDIVSFHNLRFDFIGRAIEGVYQIPSVLILKLFPVSGFKLAIYSLDFVYMFSGLLSLLVTTYLLKKRGKVEYIIFPFLSFSTVYLGIQGFAVATVLISLQIFWPLFFLVLFRRKRSKLDLGLILALLLALCFSYIPAAMFSAFLAAVAVWRLKKHKVLFWEEMTVLIASILTIPWHVYCFLKDEKYTTDNSEYLDSVSRIFDMSFSKFSTIILGGFFLSLVILLLKKKWSQKLRLNIFTLVLSATFIVAAFSLIRDTVYFSSADFSLAFNFRALGIPLTTLVAFIAFCCSEHSMFKTRFNKEVRKRALVFGAGALILASMVDLTLTRFWRIETNNLKSIIAKEPGCVTLSKEDAIRYFGTAGLVDWALSLASVVLHEGPKIHSIVFVEYRKNGKVFNQFCEKFRDSSFQYDDMNIRLDNGYLDYSRLRKKLR